MLLILFKSYYNYYLVFFIENINANNQNKIVGIIKAKEIHNLSSIIANAEKHIPIKVIPDPSVS
jgi:hypothetical protein